MILFFLFLVNRNVFILELLVFYMIKSKNQIWLSVSIAIILITMGILTADSSSSTSSNGFLSTPDKDNSFSFNFGKNSLKEKYEVSNYYCVNNGANVDMKSLGSRNDQIMDSLIYLYRDCPKAENYRITIFEPTKTCVYSFNGEIIRPWYESTGKNDIFVSEESKKIIEDDMGFKLWKLVARMAYDSETKNGISKMTEFEQILSLSYKDYLQNGITKSTLINYVYFEINNRDNCE